MAAPANANQALVIRIKPYQYIHVLDQNTNVARVVVGPSSFTRQDHEMVVAGPEPMILIPPRHYCVIQNPVVRDKKGNPIKLDGSEQVKLRHGDEEIRFDDAEMFPLYPGEALFGKVTPLQVVAPNTALRLRAVRDVDDHKAGDEWLFKGPGTYKPRVEVQVVEVVKAAIVGPNQALRLKARRETVSSDGKARSAGEEWLVREEGAYLPNVDEEIRETATAYVLTEKKALQLEAIATFVDDLGRARKAGEQWLITLADKEAHIADVNEKVIGEVAITTLSSRQYCVVLDPVDAKGAPQFGKRELRKGELSFFLRPGERLEAGIQNVHVLDSDEALLLRAREAFADGKEQRRPGDRWMIYGPTDYVPPVTIDVIEKRRAIPLDLNEGIYVRDIKTGQVRALTGITYMLKPFEELWNKEVPAIVEELLSKEVTLSKDWKVPGAGGARGTTGRDKSRVVTFRTPHNSAVQIFDFTAKKARVVFGPDLVMLGPDEQFTILSLSGDVPKRPHVIRSLSLLLGPDFMTDVVVVETSDHARLSLQLSYNWFFDVDRAAKDASKIFSVPDFVGDACKALASRVRGAVATQTFDDFHKHSARIIREAVFGVEADGSSLKNKLVFSANGLAVTNIDIQSVEPVDSKTRDALQKSVQLAIEITTKSQEASAAHEANRREQQARGKLERQKIKDEAQAEESRAHLLTLQAQSAAVESTGQATAEAKARAEAAAIEGEAAVKMAQLSSDAERIKAEARLERTKASQEAEIAHQKALAALEVKKARELAEVEAVKFKAIVEAIGADTLEAMSRSTSDAQVALLESLKLQTTMITDGHSPINLFGTASGLISNH